tara:strand:- start:8920 stop:9684 length:765 start_codon:yes stop_codon:yes gene_type:complete
MNKLNSLIFVLFSLALGQNNLELGIKNYNERAKNSNGVRADSKPIDSAIGYFERAIKIKEHELEAGVFLLKCYYFKGKHVADSDKDRKSIYNLGKALAEKLIIIYPESAAIRYWYLVNLGSWAEVYGTLAAAREGVADIMREQSKKIIDIDPYYENGGGYFMLGAVHLKSPKIPFFLSWPDNKKAVDYLTKAFNTGQRTPSQTVYLARALKKTGNKKEAKQLLLDLIDNPLNENRIVEDRDQKYIAENLIKEWG